MSKYLVPDTGAAQKMLEMLFGDGVKVSPGKPVDPDGCYGATFIDNGSELVSLCVADISFAAFAGAAMSLLPLGAAKDAIGAKALTDVMQANLGEVMNILSRLLMDDSTPHLRFEKIVRPAETAALARALADSARQDLSIALPRYGSGQISFLVT